MKSLRKKFKVLSVLLALALPSFSLLGDLSNGLVAWYPFDGNASDMSGNGNHGIVYGATLGTDRHGHANKAYNFDGNGDYISIPASSSLNITNEGSICFWMNRRINQAGSYYKSFLFCRLKDGFPNGSSSFSDHSWFIIQLYDTSSYPMRWYDGVRVGKTQINKWEHYIFTQNESSEAFLFENGFLIDDGDGVSWGGSNQPIFIGKDPRTGTYNGFLDDIRIYNRALSAEEVSSVYRLESPNHFAEMNSSVNMEMIWVEPGMFTMGSPTTEAGRSTNESQHNVTLTTGFYLGKYEVTQAQYEAVMTGNSVGLSATPSNWPNNPNRPVEKVSWDDIQVFLTRLNEQQSENLPNGWAYVLPTEAQWEYACRAGTTTAYSWGDTISASDANWNHGADANQTENVGQYSANPWGFFDMHGNAWELTADAWGSYATGTQTDPFNVGTSGSTRVRRGGSWNNDGADLRSADRRYDAPSIRRSSFGFRVGFQQITDPPRDLSSLDFLTIAENQPIGTIVGEFNATDPEGGAITYHFVDGENNNSLFTLDTNGTLKTATVFDYETDASSYTIVVQAKDELNATTEGNFTVTLTDVYEDTDGDGFRDFLEASTGSDLNDPNSTPLEQGLVAWYPFDGNASDMSGNGNHGTVHGATLGTDRHGQLNNAYNFDGVNDYLEVMDSDNFDFGDQGFSVSAWTKKFSQINSDVGVVVSQWNTGGSPGSNEWVLSGSTSGSIGRPCLSVEISNQYKSAISPDIFGLNQWSNLIGVHDGSKMKLYMDGVKVAENLDAIGVVNETGSNLFFGKYRDSNPIFSNISIDDVRVYNRALSAEEIRLLYDMEAELPAQSVTSTKLSLALSDLIDGNGSLEQALPAGSVIARKPGEAPPPGYTLFQRNEYNASLVWEEKAPVSVARRASHGVAVLDGELYFVGGQNGTGALNLVEKYNPLANQWVTVNPLSVARKGTAVAVVNGKLYAIGGTGLSSVEIFDPQNNQWTDGPELPANLENATAITYKDKIFLIGGVGPTGAFLDQVLCLDSNSNTWTQKVSMPTERSGLNLVLFEDEIWAIGGGNLYSASVDSVEAYNVENNTWSTKEPLSASRRWAASWSYDGKIYLAGGRDSAHNFLSSIEVFHKNTNQWEVIQSNLPVPNYFVDAAVIDGKVYLVAGHNGSVYFDDLFAADLPAPAMNLYFKDGNATAEAELSTLGMADGSVTLGQLAPDALAKIGLDHNPATAEGSLLAVPRGTQPPPGYTLYKRSDRNGSLVWEEKAPVSVGRSVYDGAVGLNGKIYLMGGISSDNNATHSYNPSTNTWNRQSNMINPHAAGAFATAGGKIFAIGGNPNPTSFEIYDPVSDQWTAGPAVPQPLKFCSAISLNGKVYVIGALLSGANTDRIFAYDPASQTWSEKSNMPTARHAASLLVLDEKIWVLGGWSGLSPLVPTSKVEIYDPIANTWSNGPALDIAKAWTSAWVIDGNIHVAGGNDNQGGNYRSEVLRLDAGTNQWVQVSILPEPKAYAGYAQIEGMIFQVSGSTANGVHSNKVYAADITPPMDLYYRQANGSGTITLDKLSADLANEFSSSSAVSAAVGLVSAVDYNDDSPSDHTILERTDRNASHQWEEMAPVSVARQASDGLEGYEEKIYFGGGYTSSNSATNIFESYDFSNNQWTTLQSMNVSRAGLSASFYNGKFYVFGGNDGSTSNVYASGEVYDLATQTWTAVANMPYAKSSMTAITYNGLIYCMGGWTAGVSNTGHVLVYDPLENSWTQLPDMPTPRHGFKLVILDDKIWAIGGSGIESSYLNIVESFDPITGLWKTEGSMNSERHWPVAWVENNKIFVGGGRNSSVYQKSIEYYDLEEKLWIQSGEFPQNSYAGDSAIINGMVYVAEASAASGQVSNKVYAADLLPHRDLYFRSVASETVNRGPSAVFGVDALSAAENQPVGTIVGEFNATDPDGDSVTYFLVSGAGDTHNAFFTLDRNGTLKVADVLDYETANTLSIRVQAKDELNATTEVQFTVSVMDVNDPPVGNLDILGKTELGSALSVSHSLSDDEGMGELSFNWEVDGQSIEYGGRIQDNVGGADGLNWVRGTAISPDGRHLYAAAFHDDSVSWYAINSNDESLSYLGMLRRSFGIPGLDGSHSVATSDDGKNVYSVSYSDSSVNWFDRNASSGALAFRGFIKNGTNGFGTGLKNAFDLALSKDQRHLYALGSGDNRINWFTRNDTDGSLTFGGNTFATNPMSIQISSDDRFIYTSGENRICWFERNASTGAASFLGQVRDGVDGVDGLSWATSIALSPDGKFIYATGGNDKAVSWFERNSTNGALSYAGSLFGIMDETTRVIVSDDGNNVYVVSPVAGKALSFTRNITTGQLTKIGGIQLRASGRASNGGWSRFLRFSPSQKNLYFSGAYENSILWLERHPTTGALQYGKFGAATYDVKDGDYGSIITVSAQYFDGTGREEITPRISAGQVTLQKQIVDLNSSVDLEMIWVEPGTFTMGSPESEDQRNEDEVEHDVTITQGFYLGQFEVTQAQYEAVMNGNTDDLSAAPSEFSGNPNRPVEKVSYYNVQSFLNRLNELEADNLPEGWGYALPTEAEWEYACRAGTTTIYSWGDSIDASRANYVYDVGETKEVGSYAPNSWGFYDMHGNVWEWVEDWYDEYPETHVYDPKGEFKGLVNRTQRGGAFARGADELRSASRSKLSPSNRHSNRGFRLALKKVSFTPLTDDNFRTAINLWFSDEAAAIETYSHISNWDVSQVTDFSGIFRERASFNEDVSRWDTSSVTKMDRLFYKATSFNQDIRGWDTSSVTTFSQIFREARSFDQNISAWDTSSVTSFNQAFWDATVFNGDIGDWDTSSAVDMAHMFRGASSFNQDIGNWNTSKVTSMHYIFYGAESFNQNIGGWDVSNIVDMRSMFEGASAFNGDISAWDTSSATHFRWMFKNAISFNQDLSEWNISSAETVMDMFNGAVNFDQDISGWDISSEPSMTDMFGAEDGLSIFNKSKIQKAFSVSPRWPYEWEVNDPPHSLSEVEPLVVSTRQPVGTLVGAIRAENAEANESIEYAFVPMFDPLWAKNDDSMKVWLDAADSSYIEQVNGSVIRWNNKAKQQPYLVPQEGGGNPTTGWRKHYGLNVIDFDGASGLISPNAFDLGSNFSILMVAGIDQVDTNVDTLISSYHGGSPAHFYIRSVQEGVFQTRFQNTGMGSMRNFTPDSEIGPAIYEFIFNLEEEFLYCRINGENYGKIGYQKAPDPSNYLRIFNKPGDGASRGYIDGFLAELLIFNKALLGGQRTEMENYLGAKWGIDVHIPKPTQNFELKENGEIYTTAVFDHDSEGDYEFQFRAMDEWNQTVEQVLTIRVVNAVPDELNASGDLSIYENRPVGSIISSFTGRDPDGDEFEIKLVDSYTTEAGNLFTIDQNGSLRTRVFLDYEIHGQTHPLVVEIVDEYGGKLVKEFAVSILNVVEDFDGDGIEDFYDPDDDNDGFSDEEEIAYGSNPKDRNSVANVAPEVPELFSELSMRENLSIGTYIGSVLAMDPDGDLREVWVVDVNGSVQVSSFYIDTNGSLRTARILDFESTPVINFQILAIDEHNATTSQVFTLQIEDVYEPSEPNHLVEGAAGLEMIWVEPGSFLMGSPETEDAKHAIREQQHKVTLTQGYYLGKYEVTQEQYEKVMAGNTSGLNAAPSKWKGSQKLPVEKVSVNDVKVFLERLNQSEHIAGRLRNGWAYVLPTEAEWEYACRAGATTAYNFGDLISRNDANFENDISYPTISVGQYLPNHWGFYDMHGNVAEWTSSYFGDYPLEAVIDPLGPESGANIVSRGGSWKNSADAVRSAVRIIAYTENQRVSHHGFRLAYKLVTDPPNNLRTSEKLQILENQPGGTFLGGFMSDDRNGDVISYHLVDGDGDTHNEYFYIDKNGSLRSLVPLDYEANPMALSIRVQARDSYFSSTERTFRVKLLDESELISDSVAGEGGWNVSDWFGTYLPFPSGWVYHETLRWVYLHPDQAGGYWIWQNVMGWMWTKSDLYPYLWSHEKKEWLYLLRSDEEGILYYKYSDKTIHQFNDKFDIPVSKYPKFSWDHIPRYMHTYKLTDFVQEELEYLAQFPLITIEKAQAIKEGGNNFVQRGTTVAAEGIKALNPDAKVLYYKNIIIDWHGSDATPALEAIENSYLKKTNGDFLTIGGRYRKYFDVSMPAVRNWWMEDATRMLNEPSIDGLFIDAHPKVIRDWWMPQRGIAAEKWEEVYAGYLTLLEKINQTFSSQNILLANLIRSDLSEQGGREYLHFFDGSYLEHFANDNLYDGKKADYIAMGINHVQQAAREGNIIAFTMKLGGEDGEEDLQSVDEVNLDRLNYTTALFLIMAEKYSYYFPYGGTYGADAGRDATWMHTFPIFKKKLGPPKGPAVQEGYIYTREFEHCRVILDIENEKGTLFWEEDSSR